MKKKKLLAIFGVLILTLSFVMVPVSANNHKDEGFIFYLDGVSASVTKMREKQDASSTYVAVDYTPSGGAKFSVLGVKLGNHGSTSVNCTKNNYVILYGGQTRLVRQYVYERGYTLCELFGDVAKLKGKTYGLWSPDSVGSYPYAN